jgi:DNA topoisomerase IB
MPRLRRADCADPGIRRIRSGRGFRYEDESGDRLTDEAALERIRQLAIPPAWKEVWICPDPLGHIQATGFDDAGRKQYLYHDAWRVQQDRLKYEQMLELAVELPSLRRRVKRRLNTPGLTRERVLAGAVRLLDLGFFRIGSEQYAEENESYGLATLRRSHVRSQNGAVVFDYPAKSSQRRVQEIADPQLIKLVRALKHRRGGGYELLAYRDGDRWVDVRSDEVNAYIKELTGSEFTAKDFRTWNATVLASVQLALHAHGGTSKTARKRIDRAVVMSVAEALGNTPAVCRRAYIDPRVFDQFHSGTTIEDALPDRASNGEIAELRERDRERIEAAVVEMLR